MFRCSFNLKFKKYRTSIFHSIEYHLEKVLIDYLPLAL